MKKGLLSILAGALLVVGCQNYDDQFNSIENSINALKTQVDGLSAVSSQLTSLSATVQSLSTTVSSLPSSSEIATQISTGLAGIIEDVADIEAAVAAADTSEAVAAIQADIDAQEEVLADLLASSSVFTGDVVVNSAATLDAYLAMGPALSIVNGNVRITVSTAMDQTKVQSLVDNILTIVNDLTYTSAASTIAETTFDNLTGVQSITITQGGGIRFPNLLSATTIDMKDDFESTVGVIHFGSLTTVTAFETDGTANLIQFTKATELHLTSLAYYPNASLTIETDEGAAMPFALDDIDGDGDTLDDGLTLNITGPASFSISNIADGSITLTDVATVNLTDFKGAVILAGDVESFTSNSLVSLTVSGTVSLETVDITGAADPDAEDADDDNYYGPSISLSSLSDLETVTIAGKVAAVTASSNGNLTDITISADVAGAIIINSNSDLTAVTLTGAKATSVTIGSNSDLAALTVDLTYRAGTGDDDVLDGALSVTENESLGSLTVSSDNIETLTVTGNDDLTTVDFTGLTKFGATGEPAVNIYDNDLTASKLTDLSDGTTDADNGASGDLGSATSDSGISTLKTYLTAVAADADSAAAVYFDTVESFITEAGGSNSDILYSSNTAENEGTVLLLVANTADTGDAATTAKRSFLIVLDNSTSLDANNINILTTTQMAAGLSMNAAYNVISGTDAIATAADNAEISIAAVKNASPYADFRLSANSSSVENSYTGNAATAFSFGVSDTMTLSVDGSSVTITAADVLAITSASLDEATAVRAALIAAWNTEYAKNATGTASPNLVRWKLQELTGGSKSSANFRAIAKDRGSRDIGASMSLTHSQGKTTTDSNIGIVIGNGDGVTESTADNTARGTYLMVTLTADTTGSILSQIGEYGDGNTFAIATTAKAVAITNTDFVELTSTYAANTTASNSESSLDIYPNESRLDVIIPEESNSAATSNAVSYSRVGWL